MGALLSRAGTHAPATTVIIPTYNEAASIGATVRAARTQAEQPVEVVVADGYSSDATARHARRAGATVVRVRGGRGHQIEAAARAARGATLVLLHADTAVPGGYDVEAATLLRRPRVSCGAFSLRIGADGWALRVVEAGANWRARALQTPYGDQAMFMRPETLRAVGGYPQMPFLDDLELARRLGRRGRVAVSRKRVVTSARRWLVLGVARTTLLNQAVLAGYLCGVPVDTLQRWYRGSLRRAAARQAPR